MPMTEVQRKTAVSASAVASLSATFDSPITPGNLVLAFACSDAYEHASTKLTAQAFTLAVERKDDVGLHLYYKVAGADEAETVTFTPGVPASTTLAVFEYATPISTPLDRTASDVRTGDFNAGTTAA